MNQELSDLGIEFERALHLITKHFPIPYKTSLNSRKPVLFHDLRVAIYFYENWYSKDIVLAWLLHDVLEWSEFTEEMLKNEFWENILKLVKANTKNSSIKDKKKMTEDLIKRCVELWEDALIIKTADIIDSFKRYSKRENEKQLARCVRHADAIFNMRSKEFEDKIFEELVEWREKFSYL